MDNSSLPTCSIIKLAKTIVLVMALVASSFLSFSQNQTTEVTPDGTWFWQYLPPDYNSNSNNYPIVFFLHGLGERGNSENDLGSVTNNGPPQHVKNGYKFPFILISPQLKTTKTWNGSYIDEVVEYAKTYLRVDLSRMYMTGLSLGGGGTWIYAQDPELGKKLAAVAPICGHTNNTSKACNFVANKLPVWAFHGDADGTININITKRMVNAINACVPAPDPLAMMTTYPGVGHNAWDKAYRTDHVEHNPNLYEWLLQFRNGGVNVNTGNDIVLNLPTNSTNITGTASTESGSITSYTWTKVTGPAATLTNTSSSTVSLSNLVQGIYTFRLTATNNNNENAYDDVKVTVLQVNQSPTADAGADGNITLPTNSLNLNGRGTDSDGSIASYNWVQVSGPVATITGINTATLSLSNMVEGTYSFTLTVTDNLNSTGTDRVIVVVNAAAVNQLPSANAGGDRIVNLPTNTLTITGTGSDPDGTIISHLWEKLSGPTVTMTATSNPTVSLADLLSGVYTFRLTVTDDDNGRASDEVEVTVVAANQSPVANAGGDFSITLPTNSTTITGSGSDADGSISTYAWTQVNGPNTATLTNTGTVTVSASDLIQGNYTFRLTVTDDKAATGIDDIRLTVNVAPVNQKPVANAGRDKDISLPINTVTINGAGTDSDGSIAIFSWVQTSGQPTTLVNENTPDLIVNNLVAGTFVFRLTVTDNQGEEDSDNITVVVQPEAVNQAPRAIIGVDITLTLPTNSTSIPGSGTDVDGTIISYDWIKLSGPSATLANANTATLQLTDLVEGSYKFQLMVTDDDRATDTEEISVFVNTLNVAPTARAGNDITISLPISSTSITGTGTDPDGTIAGYSWSFVSGPTTPTLSNGNTSTVDVSGLNAAGTYNLLLTVTDDDGDEGTDPIKIIVNAANLTPTAIAGPNKIITLPTTTASFTGFGTDTDGTISAYAWQQISGTPVILTNENTATLTVTVPTDGRYTFRLTVTDDDTATDTDDVVLVVNPAAINQAPTASVGTPQNITLPINTTNFTGSGSDPDGSIVLYEWTKVNGPTLTLTNSNTPTVTLSDLIEGSYTLRLTVTDNGGLTDWDEVTVTVLPEAVNQPPVARAGSNKTITLPVNSITIFGAGSDADGTVVEYSWLQTRGPVTILTNEGTPNVSLSNLAVGEYVFQITVTDDDGAIDTDDVLLIVNAATVNQVPTAFAGTDKVVNLPTSSINLTGSGSDPDGSIVLYAWVKTSGPSVTLGSTGQPILSLSNLTEGSYTFTLEVTDDDGATDVDDVKVTVLAETVNQAPIVNAGADKTLYLPNNTLLISGLASDADGIITKYQWAQIAGTTVTLTNLNSPALTVSNMIEGEFRFRLTATDDDRATSSDEVIITVRPVTANQPPSANAGGDKIIKLPTNTTSLRGSGLDGDGTIATHAWIKLSGPPVILSNQNTATVTLANLVEGVYRFQLTVTDNLGDSDTDEMIVTVLPASINIPPIANAGSNVSIQLPINSALLKGSATDDGTIVRRAWQKTAGPPVTLSGEATDNLALTNLEEGSYEFRFTVTDDGNLTDYDDVKVIVFPVLAVTLPPTVDAGEDQRIQLPVNSTTFTSVANSEGSIITSYKWTQTSGTPVDIVPDTTAAIDIANLSLGRNTFSVIVLDGDGQSATDNVSVTVEEEDPTARPQKLFSPDAKGDISTETWSIENASLLDDCEVFVYNRQGQKVYSSMGYPSQWDGTHQGRPLPDGAYYYVFRCSGQKTQSGSVTIARLK